MKKEILQKLIAKPGEKHKVSDFSTSYAAGLKKEKVEVLKDDSIEALAKLQDVLYAQDRYSVLIIFQAMDAAGKDGTIKHVMSGINPQGCQVFSFKQPSAEELDHDYLWRIYKSLPERGRIGVFNRSHYEDVLVAKVHPEILLKSHLPDVKQVEDVTKNFWKKRYEQINNFEKHLTENGTLILKFFLNVSHKEQEKRFLARLEDESKNWKFSSSDLKEREFWDDYMQAYSDMLTETSTENSLWYVIPADNKWFMRYIVSQIICHKIGELDLHYPKLTPAAKAEIEEYKLKFANGIREQEESEKKSEKSKKEKKTTEKEKKSDKKPKKQKESEKKD